MSKNIINKQETAVLSIKVLEYKLKFPSNCIEKLVPKITIKEIKKDNVLTKEESFIMKTNILDKQEIDIPKIIHNEKVNK